MAAGLREFFESPKGKGVVVVLGLVLIGAIFWLLRDNLSGSEAASISRDRMFMDAATGKPFEHTLQAGDKIPLLAPSGKNTGYPAELCYWTKDGKPKSDPTPVLLNSYVGKPGATFCPDCGRLVVAHNPGAAEGAKPPPTQAEYEQRRAPRGGTGGGQDQGDGR
jgi:hypothetical protein